MAATGCLAVSLLLLTMQVVRWLQTGKWEATTLGSLARLQHAQVSFDSAIVDRVAQAEWQTVIDALTASIAAGRLAEGLETALDSARAEALEGARLEGGVEAETLTTRK